MNRKKIDILFEKYLNGTSSQEESEWIEKWLDARSKGNDWDWTAEDHKKSIGEEIYKKIDDEATRILPKKNRIYTQRAIAALLLIGLAFSFWFTGDTKKDMELVVFDKVVELGTKTATLKMGNGEIIYLDDREEGVLSKLDNVRKVAAGSILYHTSEDALSDQVFENTLTIPRGGQYQVILPDGTSVWLNSETKLIYPTRFVGKERKVKLIGEAYFDVAKSQIQPFIVQSGSMDILVMGTEFNVSAYEGESEVSTTLIEGSVEVSSKGQGNMKLIPGQQAYQVAGVMAIEKREVDVNSIVSWKEGYFSFDHQSLEEVMNEVARWYDVDYKIVGTPKITEQLGGTFSKEKSLDELLRYLEQLVDIKITREERSVMLMY